MHDALGTKHNRIVALRDCGGAAPRLDGRGRPSHMSEPPTSPPRPPPRATGSVIVNTASIRSVAASIFPPCSRSTVLQILSPTQSAPRTLGGEKGSKICSRFSGAIPDHRPETQSIPSRVCVRYEYESCLSRPSRIACSAFSSKFKNTASVDSGRPQPRDAGSGRNPRRCFALA